MAAAAHHRRGIDTTLARPDHEQLVDNAGTARCAYGIHKIAGSLTDLERVVVALTCLRIASHCVGVCTVHVGHTAGATISLHTSPGHLITTCACLAVTPVHGIDVHCQLGAPLHSERAGQSEVCKHSTQRPWKQTGRPGMLAHSASATHCSPSMHVFDAVSHVLPSGQSPSTTHATHIAVSLSHAGVAPMQVRCRRHRPHCCPERRHHRCMMYPRHGVSASHFGTQTLLIPRVAQVKPSAQLLASPHG